jgi:hypothetical protein
VSLGERGGTTATFQEGVDRIEASKAHWSAAIRAYVLETADIHGEVHADDLIALGVASSHPIGGQHEQLE